MARGHWGTGGERARLDIPFKAKVAIARADRGDHRGHLPADRSPSSPLEEGVPALVSDFGADARVIPARGEPPRGNQPRLRGDRQRRPRAPRNPEARSVQRKHRSPSLRRAPPHGSRTAGGSGATRRHPGGCRRRALRGGQPHGRQRTPARRGSPAKSGRSSPTTGSGRLALTATACVPLTQRQLPPAGTAIATTPSRDVSCPSWSADEATSASEKTLSGESRKLIACIHAAHGDVSRLQACPAAVPAVVRGGALRAAVSRRGGPSWLRTAPP